MTSDKRRPHQHVGGSFIPRCSIAAFCETDEAHEILSGVFANPIMSRAEVGLNRGSLDAVLKTYDVGETPDLLIVEFSGFADELDPLADICSEDTLVIIIGSKNDVIQYRKLIAKGVEDYLFHPLTEDIVISSLMRAFAGQRPFNAAKMITAVGAGGGMGSSTVAQSIATILSADPQAKVLLMDLDLYFGSSTLNFDFAPVKGLRDLLRFSGTLAVDDVELLMAEQRPRLFVLAAEPDLNPPEYFDIETLMKIIDLASLTVDFIVFDLPSGWGEVQSTVVDRSDMVCIVAEPTLLGFRNAIALKAHLDLTPEQRVTSYLVLNKYDQKSETTLDKKAFQKTYDASKITTVPELTDLFKRAHETSKLPLEVSGSKVLRGVFTSLVYKLQNDTKNQISGPVKTSLLGKLFKRSI
jgi:pilus assembly protein CpaE